MNFEHEQKLKFIIHAMEQPQWLYGCRREYEVVYSISEMAELVVSKDNKFHHKTTKYTLIHNDLIIEYEVGIKLHKYWNSFYSFEYEGDLNKLTEIATFLSLAS